MDLLMMRLTSNFVDSTSSVSCVTLNKCVNPIPNLPKKKMGIKLSQESIRIFQITQRDEY